MTAAVHILGPRCRGCDERFLRGPLTDNDVPLCPDCEDVIVSRYEHGRAVVECPAMRWLQRQAFDFRIPEALDVWLAANPFADGRELGPRGWTWLESQGGKHADDIREILS